MSKQNEKLKDEIIIRFLKSDSDAEKTKAFKAIYARFYKMIDNFITSNSGDPSQTKDIFQDCLIILFKKVKTKDFALTSGLGTYIYSICRNLWLKELKLNGRTSDLTEEIESIPIDHSTIDSIIHDENSLILASMLDKLGDNCKRVLLLYYYDKLSMKQIAEKLNFSSEQIAKNNKSKCMKKLRALVASNPKLTEFFRN